jgi:serine-type D-Ala-D-Ala carboxypeptidase (penicillin-binding protein 5/6)
VNRFVEEMNERARASGLKHAHFENPVGFDARGHYSSARDLARMARLAIQDLEFRKIVSTEYATIYILDAGEDRFAASIRALRYGFAAHDRKTSWSRARGRLASMCLTGGRRLWISWHRAAWMVSWKRAPTWSAMSTW